MDRRSFVKSVAFLPNILCSGIALAQDSFRMTLVRTFESNSCTTGELFVNGKFLCHTLELPWRENKSYISSIPSKTYAGNIRYDKNDHWRIELRNEDTAPRSGVQIHVGNFPKDVEGCILPGMEVVNSKSEVLDSATAYNRIKAAFYDSDDPVASPNKAISLDIRYNELPTEFIVWDEQANLEARYRQDGIAWLLFSQSSSGRHVWDEIRRTNDFLVFKGIVGSGVWQNRYIRLALHGGGDMQLSETGDNWTVFGEGAKITRKDATSKI
jgi:hypothetical protein